MPHPSIELWLMQWLGSLAGASALLDSAMHLLLGNDLLKGVPFGTALLLVWAVPRAQHEEDERESLLCIVLATALSLFIGRAIQNFIVSPRPLMVPELASLYPPVFHDYRLDWNAFPSDHVALYFTLALGIYQLRRPLGIALIAWCLAGVGVSRIYAGYHYPIDILGGMAVAATSLIVTQYVRVWFHPLLNKVVRLAAHYPAVAMAAMFLIAFQVATVFNTVRELGEFGRVSMRLVLTALLQ